MGLLEKQNHITKADITGVYAMYSILKTVLLKKKITGRFRADFRLAIVMVCARRAAAMQLGSGLPHASIRGLRPPAPAVDDFIAVNT